MFHYPTIIFSLVPSMRIEVQEKKAHEEKLMNKERKKVESMMTIHTYTIIYICTIIMGCTKLIIAIINI